MLKLVFLLSKQLKYNQELDKKKNKKKNNVEGDSKKQDIFL